MSYTSLGIKKAMEMIAHNQLLLPAIQREVVWEPSQIEKLFDSILSKFPINSMLFWKYEIKNTSTEKDEYRFYEFLKKYDQSTPEALHNSGYDISGEKSVLCVLDGQQRLTSLFLGLKGYMKLKRPYCRSNKSTSFDKKYLYLNLLYDPKQNNSEDVSNKYEFKFKTEEEVEQENNEKVCLWFKMVNLLNCSSYSQFTSYLPIWYTEIPDYQNLLGNFFIDLNQCFITGSDVLNYYEEETDSLDRALQIFVRINSGGTALDYTDFLMSMIVSKWPEGRENIENSLDIINRENNLNIPKDIFLRACLYLTDAPLAFKADNFKTKGIEKIRDQFPNIVTYLRVAAETFNKFGFNKETLRSNLIILPIAQFIRENTITDFMKINSMDLEKMKLWIQLSILGRVFSGQTPAYLSAIRNVIKNKKHFPFDEIITESNRLGKSLTFKRERIENLFDNASFNSQDSRAILTLLYPQKDYLGNRFDEDHIYPQKLVLKDKKKFEYGNYVANLNPLQENLNKQKNDKMPEEWLKEKIIDSEEIRKFKEHNYIPVDLELTEENYPIFIKERRKKMLNKLSDLLNIED